MTVTAIWTNFLGIANAQSMIFLSFKAKACVPQWLKFALGYLLDSFPKGNYFCGNIKNILLLTHVIFYKMFACLLQWEYFSDVSIHILILFSAFPNTQG